MGTWGPGLYSNDDASDIKNDVRDMLAYGWTREAIITELTRNYNLRQIDEETSPVWLTIADTMWNYGILTEEIKRIAFRIIDEGIDIAAWAEKSTSIRKKRETVLNELRKKLVMQQPTSKKPRKSHFYRCNWPLGSVYAIPSCNGEYHAFIVVEEDEYKPSRYAPESDYVRTVSVALLCWSGNPEQLMQSLSHDIPILCMPFYNGGRIGETIGTYISINPYDFPPNIIKSLHYCGQVSPQFCKTIMINPMSHHSLFLSRFKYEYDYALSSNTIFHFSNDGKLISFESYQCNWEIGEVYALPAQTDYSLTVENRTPYHAFIVVDEGLYKLFTTLPEICSLRTVYIAILEWEGLPERLIHDLENGVSVLKCVECRPLGITNSQEEALRFCGHIDKLLCHKIAAQYSPPFMCTTLARFENDYRILSKKDIEACYFPFIKVQE